MACLLSTSRQNTPDKHILQSKLFSIKCVQNTPYAADKTSQYVRQLLEPEFSRVPVAADIPALFKASLHRSGTLPFPVPDVFYQSQRIQDDDMKYYLAPVSQSDAVYFGSVIHSVLLKTFHEGGTTQAGMGFACFVSAGFYTIGFFLCGVLKTSVVGMFQPTCFHTTGAGLCANTVNALCALLLMLLSMLSTLLLGVFHC